MLQKYLFYESLAYAQDTGIWLQVEVDEVPLVYSYSSTVPFRCPQRLTKKSKQTQKACTGVFLSLKDMKIAKLLRLQFKWFITDLGWILLVPEQFQTHISTSTDHALLLRSSYFQVSFLKYLHSSAEWGGEKIFDVISSALGTLVLLGVLRGEGTLTSEELRTELHFK